MLLRGRTVGDAVEILDLSAIETNRSSPQKREQELDGEFAADIFNADRSIDRQNRRVRAWAVHIDRNQGVKPHATDNRPSCNRHDDTEKIEVCSKLGRAPAGIFVKEFRSAAARHFNNQSVWHALPQRVSLWLVC